MGEEKEILLRGKVCAYLTCRLMGDPGDTFVVHFGSGRESCCFRTIQSLNAVALIHRPLAPKFAHPDAGNKYGENKSRFKRRNTAAGKTVAF